MLVQISSQAEQEAIMRSIPASQQGLTLRDFRKMEYLSQVCSDPFSDDACSANAAKQPANSYIWTD